MSKLLDEPIRIDFEPIPTHCPHCGREWSENEWWHVFMPKKVTILGGKPGLGYMETLACPHCWGTTQFLLWWQSDDNEHVEALQ